MTNTDLDVGLLLLRCTIGFLVCGHGCRKLFGWFGGAGFAATTELFRTLGYRPPAMAVLAAGLCELGGGLLLLSGFLTPLAAVMLVGSMLNAAMVQWPNGLWFANRGAEYPLVLAGVAAVLAFTGPGDVSLSSAVGVNPHGVGWGLAAVVVAAVAAAGVRASRRVPASVG